MRILLAEDDGPLADVLCRGLKKAGYVVDLAKRGDDAVSLLQGEDYSAGIIDWRMPGLEGTEVIKWARANGLKLPILMLTAKDTYLDRVEGLDAGADDYLVKPFDFNELFARIRALLRRGEFISSPLLKAGEVTLDPAKHEVIVNEKTVSLSPQEFSILEILMRRKEQVITRDTLANQVWEMGSEVSWNAMEVQIARLRAKLVFGGVQIMAIRKVGYKLLLK
jgi:DNA-binding response OmpR family regulator